MLRFTLNEKQVLTSVSMALAPAGLVRAEAEAAVFSASSCYIVNKQMKFVLHLALINPWVTNKHFL